MRAAGIIGMVGAGVLSACAAAPLPMAEPAEAMASASGVAYGISYSPYGVVMFNMDQSSEVVAKGPDGEPLVVAVDDLNSPTVSVRRVDQAPMTYAGRTTALELAVTYCQGRGLAEEDRSERRALFFGDRWVFYGICKRPANTRHMVTS